MRRVVAHFALLIMSASTGCTTVVVEFPPPDASTVDASTNTDAMSAEDATMSPDAADAGLEDVMVVDATSQADAAPDATAEPICADHPECCFNGQPIRAGLVCGTYPASAAAACSSAGTCEPLSPQQCTLVSACCDGWRPRQQGATACNCIEDGRYVGGTVGTTHIRGCDQSPANNPVGPGNGLGFCGTATYPEAPIETRLRHECVTLEQL